MTRTKEITYAAMLTALSLVYIMYMPTLEFGVWSFTPFSHIFIMLGTFISPFIGIFTALGTFFGFFFKGVNPLVLFRAGSHIIFVLVMVLMLKKFKTSKSSNVLLICAVVAIVHAVFEIVAVYVAIWLAFPVADQSVSYILGVVGGGTLAHSFIDFYAGYGVYKVLKKSRIV